MRGDAAAMASLYTADAVIFPPGQEMISGREAIQRYWTLPSNRRITHHRATATEIRLDGDHAYDYGVYELRGERDGQPYGPVLGKYVIVWRRTPEGWRMHLDMWNPRPQTMSTLPSKPLESGHAPVNGIEMYYEVHGRRDGVPLVLLHGGGSTIEVTFSRILPVFASSRRVIAVEEQGHGRTTDRDAPVAFETSADDVAALLRHLQIEKADLFGFSNGASVALQVAIRHPQLVRKLVFASSITKKDGAHPQLWEHIRQADFSNMPQPLKDAFLRVNPDVQKLKTMHDKDAARMRSFKDVPDDLVRSVRAPTLIVLGDQDIVKPEHAFELSRLISGARLLILPGGHGDYLGEAVVTQKETRYPELTARLIEEFLDSR